MTAHCLCKHDHWWCNFFNDTLPDQWLHMPLQTLWYSTRPMMAHYLCKHDHWGWKSFYNTPLDQQWHIASANMTGGDVNFFIILRQTKNHTLPLQIWLPVMWTFCKLFYHTLPDQKPDIASTKMAGGDVNFFDTLPDQQLHIASTNMTASNVIYSYDTLPDQWLRIALASMIIGEVIFYDTPPDQRPHCLRKNNKIFNDLSKWASLTPPEKVFNCTSRATHLWIFLHWWCKFFMWLCWSAPHFLSNYFNDLSE